MTRWLGLVGLVWVGAALVSACQGPTPRGYVQVRGGWSGAEDSGHGADVESDTFPGPSVAGALGARLGAGLRAEVEVSYRQHVFGDFAIAGSEVGGHGDAFAYAAMLNAFYDFATQSPWRPYLGVGTGLARVGYEVDSFGMRFLDDDDDVFAVQGLVGLGREFGDWWFASVGYRLLATENPVMRDGLGRRFDAEYLSHTVELGLAVSF
ncbi:MAG: outer membrane beta-barrel protein [Planctomycetota bacterium]